MQRAAVSVPANFGEGFCRRRPRDKARFYTIAEGSAAELKYYFILAGKLKYLPACCSVPPVLEEVRRMLRALVNTTLAGPV